MKKIKVGIVGFGRIGQNGHYKEIIQYPEMYEIIAVADTAESRRQDALKMNPDIRTYSSLDDMLENPELDMITIGTRHLDHVPMAVNPCLSLTVPADKPVSDFHRRVNTHAAHTQLNRMKESSGFLHGIRALSIANQ